MADVTTLPNGVRILSETMPHVETVSLGVWVAAGARDERVSEQGISHLLEHMAFKGTARRTARQIAEEIEEVGGELNAATGLETTAYFARVLKGDEGVAVELIADILRAATFAPDDLAREKEVIIQEIAGINDSPDEIAFDLVQAAAFPDQPVGRPVIGTPRSVSRIGADDLRGFLGRHYGAGRLVLAAAGATDHGRLVRLGEALFGDLNTGSGRGVEAARYEGGQRAAQRRFEQSHLLMAYPAPSYFDADFYTGQVFSGLFGGGMSSRLFQEVRERRGLCYSVYSSAWALSDAGLLYVHAATGEPMLRELVDVLHAEIAEAASAVPGEREVGRAKAQIKAGLLASLESSGARVDALARQSLLLGRLVPMEELVGRIESVTAEAVRALAEKIFTARAAVAVVGAGRASGDHARRAARIGA